LSPENLQRALDLVAEINPSFESTADEVVLDINAQVCNVNNVYYQCHPLSNCVSYTISYSEREPWRNTKVVVLETASCVKNQGKAAYNTPNGGTPSRTLRMQEL